jgi:hypothetical protein
MGVSNTKYSSRIFLKLREPSGKPEGDKIEQRKPEGVIRKHDRS